MLKIRKDDEVIVLTGKDKGKQGKVTRVIAKDPARKKNKRLQHYVFVDGVNLVKKHEKGDPQRNKTGGIVEKEAPLAISNVAIVNPETNKPDRIGFKFLENGKKVRYFKSNGEVLEKS